MYPKRAPTGYTWSPEPEIARKHFGFEFWLTVALFLFLAGMIIAQWLFSALVKPLETPGAVRSAATHRRQYRRLRRVWTTWMAGTSPGTSAATTRRLGVSAAPTVTRPSLRYGIAPRAHTVNNQRNGFVPSDLLGGPTCASVRGRRVE
jgi:hypothetical protein